MKEIPTELLISRFLEGLGVASVAASALAQFQMNPNWIGVRTAIDMTKEIVVQEIVTPMTASVTQMVN